MADVAVYIVNYTKNINFKINGELCYHSFSDPLIFQVRKFITKNLSTLNKIKFEWIFTALTFVRFIRC